MHDDGVTPHPNSSHLYVPIRHTLIRHHLYVPIRHTLIRHTYTSLYATPYKRHVFHFPKKTGEVQSFIHYNFQQAGGLSATEAVPEELEVFDCIYLGATSLRKKQKASDDSTHLLIFWLTRGH